MKQKLQMRTTRFCTAGHVKKVGVDVLQCCGDNRVNRGHRRHRDSAALYKIQSSRVICIAQLKPVNNRCEQARRSTTQSPTNTATPIVKCTYVYMYVPYGDVG